MDKEGNNLKQDMQIIIKSLKEKKSIEQIEKENNFIVDRRAKMIYEKLLPIIDIIEEEYKNTSIKKMSVKYGISCVALSKYLKLLNIEILDANPEKQIYIDKKEELIEKYKTGISLTKLAKQYGLGRNRLVKKLKEWDVEIDYTSNSVKKYKEDFFEVINTEEKAYWLGFLYADGYNYFHSNAPKGYTALNISIKDLEHLKKFGIATTYNYEDSMIYYRTIIDPFGYDLNLPIEKKRKFNICTYRINCKKIREDLVKQGCIQNKSLILEFPTTEQVPVELQHHFIRGYFDGDGYSVKTEKTKSIGLIGTKNFLTSIDLIFRAEIENYGKECISKRGNYYNLKKGGRKITKKISDWLYKDATIYLERKKKF